MYTYSIIILKIARKINRNVDFSGFFKRSIRLSANPHWKLRRKTQSNLQRKKHPSLIFWLMMNIGYMVFLLLRIRHSRS